MLQRHAKEHSFDHVERALRSGLNAGHGKIERFRIVCKSSAHPAINVSRKLIEQNDEAQAPAGTTGPEIQLASARAFQQRAKASSNGVIASSARLIGSGGIAEPKFAALREIFRGERQRAEPELTNLRGAIHDPQLV
jgi:hypothetical protein